MGIEYIDESTVNEDDLGLRWIDGIRAEDIKRTISTTKSLILAQDER